MKKACIIFLSFVSLLFMGVNHLSAQPKVISGPEWNFILGDWVGEGTGKPGDGGGWFTFNKDLGGNILIRKSHTVFPAVNGKPETVHDDLLIIYLDNSGALSKAIYFDNEGHIINYVVSFNQTDKSLVFTSEAQQNLPRFRLTYKTLDNKSLGIDFEIAAPNTPDSFSKYLSGKAHKKPTI